MVNGNTMQYLTLIYFNDYLVFKFLRHLKIGAKQYLDSVTMDKLRFPRKHLAERHPRLNEGKL